MSSYIVEVAVGLRPSFEGCRRWALVLICVFYIFTNTVYRLKISLRLLLQTINYSRAHDVGRGAYFWLFEEGLAAMMGWFLRLTWLSLRDKVTEPSVLVHNSPPRLQWAVESSECSHVALPGGLAVILRAHGFIAGETAAVPVVDVSGQCISTRDETRNCEINIYIATYYTIGTASIHSLVFRISNIFV